jgi:hypothetical protein
VPADCGPSALTRSLLLVLEGCEEASLPVDSCSGHLSLLLKDTEHIQSQGGQPRGREPPLAQVQRLPRSGKRPLVASRGRCCPAHGAQAAGTAVPMESTFFPPGRIYLSSSLRSLLPPRSAREDERPYFPFTPTGTHATMRELPGSAVGAVGAGGRPKGDRWGPYKCRATRKRRPS